jgi:hypothetical protein
VGLNDCQRGMKIKNAKSGWWNGTANEAFQIKIFPDAERLLTRHVLIVHPATDKARDPPPGRKIR